MKLVTFTEVSNAGVSASECMQWVSDSIKGKGNAILPPKTSLHPGRNGAFANFMPSIVALPDGRLRGGVKVVTRYPGREPSLRSCILLFDAMTGEMLALMDGDWVTAMRTGAVAAHSIELFARSGFTRVSLMGLGNVARATMLMLAEAHPNRVLQVRLLRHKGQEAAFEERFAGHPGLRFEEVDSYGELADGAEVLVSAATYLDDDVCEDEVFAEGVTVVPVHTRGFSNCDLFFERVFADDEGHVSHFKNFARFRSFAEVGDVVRGLASGRESDSERILVYNIGVATHDVYFASRILDSLDMARLPDLDLEQPAGKFWV